MPIRPVALGLTLCEFAVIDENTHNVSAVSCFSRRFLDGGLEAMPPFYALAFMVGGHESMPAKLLIERLDTLETTNEKSFTLGFANSLEEIRALVRVRASAIPVFGYYNALFVVDGEMIAQKRFSILPRRSKK